MHIGAILHNLHELLLKQLLHLWGSLEEKFEHANEESARKLAAVDLFGFFGHFLENVR